MTELPAQVIVAIGTVVAALLTGVIAMVNLTLAKEQKVSEMRQAWIDGLRSDLATCFSSYRLIATAISNKWDQAEHGIPFTHEISEEKVNEATVNATESLYRIKMRLNVREAEHIELERLLNAIQSKFETTEDGDTSIRSKTVDAIALANTQARVVLKLEWERVKRGEPAYSKLRTWVVPVVLGVIAAFAVALLGVKYR